MLVFFFTSSLPVVPAGTQAQQFPVPVQYVENIPFGTLILQK
jgi:hypothetical protein